MCIKKYDIKAQAFKDLFRKVYHDNNWRLLADYYKMQAELAVAGYHVEHGWGYYLHMPNGEVIVLDYWNEPT